MRINTKTPASKLAGIVRSLTVLMALSLVCAQPAFAKQRGKEFTGGADGGTEVACYLKAELDAVRQAVNSFYGNQHKSEVRIINNAVDVSQISAKGQGQLRYDIGKKKFRRSNCQVTIKARTSVSNGKISKKDLRNIKKDCRKGGERACFNLGVMYEKGKGVNQKYSTAAGYYQKACDGGHAHGCFNLGVMYEKGKGVNQKYSTAAGYYQKACDGGHAHGCDATHSLYERFCNSDVSWGCLELGAIYSQGKGVDQSSYMARKYYKEACTKGNALGCIKMAWVHKKGIEISTNDKKALKYYEKACENGSTHGCNQAGIMYEKGEGTYQNLKNIPDALKYYGMGCKAKRANKKANKKDKCIRKPLLRLSELLFPSR